MPVSPCLSGLTWTRREGVGGGKCVCVCVCVCVVGRGEVCVRWGVEGWRVGGWRGGVESSAGSVPALVWAPPLHANPTPPRPAPLTSSSTPPVIADFRI